MGSNKPNRKVAPLPLYRALIINEGWNMNILDTRVEDNEKELSNIFSEHDNWQLGKWSKILVNPPQMH